MPNCSECGAYMPENTRFCPQCGASAAAAAAGGAQQNYQPNNQQNYQSNNQQAYQQNYQQGYQQQYQKPQPVAPGPDAEQFRLLMALSYIFCPCLFIALILDKDSNYVRRHGNQVLALYLWFILCSLCCIIPVLGWVVGGIGYVVGVVFLFICFFRALKYDIFEIPITGKWQIIPQKTEKQD